MKLLIDQDIAGRTSALLRLSGHDCVSAFEIGMNRAADQSIIDFAVEHSRIIATLDSDYHRIIATQFLVCPSVIQLREREPNSKLASELIHEACTRFESELLTGCLLTVSCKSMRLRSLPIRQRQTPDSTM